MATMGEKGGDRWRYREAKKMIKCQLGGMDTIDRFRKVSSCRHHSKDRLRKEFSTDIRYTLGK